MKKILLLNTFVLGLSWLSFAQPTNDECTNAIALSVGTSCTYTTYDNSGATASTSEVDPSCASYSGGDVWFSVIVPSSGSLVLNSNSNGGMTDSGMSLYSGTCGSLTELICDDDGSENGTMSKITQTGLTSGQLLYVRFWGYNGEIGTFEICATTPPPAPSNDECVNAINLLVNSDLLCTSLINATIESATTSAEANDCMGTADDDVWFKFTATAANNRVSILNAVGSSTDMVLAIYSGGCANLNQLNCDEYFADGATNTNGLTIGNTYYVRTFSFSSVGGQDTDFDICITTPPPPPTNDECANATPLSIGTSCVFANYTNVSATASTGEIVPTCASYVGGDVWFSLVVPAGGNFVVNSNTNGGMTDSGMSLYSGTCGALTQILCDDDSSENGNMSKISQTGLSPGSTLYVRFWGYNGAEGSFDICASTPPPAPTNDECSAASTVSVNTDLTCTNFVSATLESATASTQTNDCLGTADDDVWFQFVASNANHNISLDNITGSAFDLNFNVYNGSCGTLGTPVLCSDNNSNSLTGLTVGNTYFVRVFSFTATSGQDTDFDICITTPPPPPSNDECANAIPLIVGSNCNYVTYTSTSATASTGEIAPTCASYLGGDVWFSIVVPSGGEVIINSNTNGGLTDSGMSLYSGSCGTLTEIICDDDGSENGNMSKISQSGLTPGSTLYVRFWGYNGSEGSFDICASTPPLPPSNDECSGAISVTTSSTSTCTNPTSGMIDGATASVDANSCGGTADDDVWYSFVATSTSHDIELTNIVGETDLYHTVYAGVCGNLGTSIICSDPNTSNLTGLTIGNTYYLRIYSWSGTTGLSSNFDICITNPIVSSPTIAIGTTSNPTTCNGTDGIIQITGTNTGTGTLSWTGTSSGSLANITLPYTFSNFAAGTYDFTFNDGTMSNIISATLNNPSGPAIPTISASGALSFCQGGSVVLTSSATIGNTWSNGATTQSITITSSGTFTVFSTVSGCSSATSLATIVNVTPNNTPSVTIMSDDSDNSICTGTNVTFTATPTNGGLTPSYQWKINGVDVGTNSPNFASSGLTNNAIVSCVLTSNNACANPLIVTSNSISMTVNTSATASVSILSDDANNSICAGTDVTFTATALNAGATPTYQWKINGLNVGVNSSTFSSNTLLNGDQITCSLTSSNACGASTVNSNLISFTVNSNPSISLGLITNPSSCGNNDGSIQITGSGTGTLSWTGTTNSSLSTTLPSTISNLTAGSYNFSFTTSCPSNSISSALSDPGAPVAPIISASGALTFCQGGSVNLTSSSSTNNTWSSGQTTQSITVTNSGNYYVTKTVAGCSSSSNVITVTANPNPTAAIITANGSSTICNGGSVILSSNLSTGNLWSNSSTDQSITVGSAGNYFVTTTLGSCTTTSNIISITVTSSPVIALGSVSQTTSCGGSDGTIQINGSGSGTISWTGTASGSQAVVLPILLQNFAIGTYDLSFNNGCNSNIVSATISQPALPATPTISAQGLTEFCEGGNVILQSSSTIGNLWTTNETTQNIIVNTSGLYSVTVSSAPNCTATSNQIEVIVNPIPLTPVISAFGSTNFCQGDSVVLTSSATGGNFWTSGAMSQSITVYVSGSYIVNVIENGCTSLPSNQIVVVSNPIPQVPSISTSGSINFCEGQTLTLTSDITSGVTWSPNGETTASIAVTTPGNYFVTNTVNGCSASSPVIVTTVNPLPFVDLAPITDMCDTSNTIILNQGTPSGGIYSVNGSSASSFTPSSSNIGLNTIVYYVSDNICTNSDTVIFNVLDCSPNIGLKEYENNIKLLPNPTSGIFEIQGINLSEINTIQVFDPIGKLILTSRSNYIDLSNYANGMYHLVIKTERFESIQKIQVLK